MSIRFDETDCRIVQALFENSRITNADLAKQIHMSESQCSRRLHRIEQAGIITGYTALVDYEALDLHACAFATITLDHSKTTRELTETAICKRPEVVRGYRTGGDSDYVVSILTADLSAFQRAIDEFNGREGGAVGRAVRPAGAHAGARRRHPPLHGEGEFRRDRPDDHGLHSHPLRPHQRTQSARVRACAARCSAGSRSVPHARRERLSDHGRGRRPGGVRPLPVRHRADRGHRNRGPVGPCSRCSTAAGKGALNCIHANP